MSNAVAMAYITGEARMVVSEAQLTMLRDLARWCAAEERKHGKAEAWVELGQLVMEHASDRSVEDRGGIAWPNANRVLGALERKGLIEHHSIEDDLVRPSVAGYALLAEGHSASGPVNTPR